MLEVCGFVDLLRDAVLSGPSASTDTTVEELRADELGDSYWRTPYPSAASTWLKVNTQALDYKVVERIVLGDHNLDTYLSLPSSGLPIHQPMGSWRVRVITIPADFRVSPTSMDNVLNLVGVTVSLAGDPEHPGTGSRLTAPAPTSNTRVRLRFPTPTAATLSTTVNQKFRINVNRTGVGGSDPTVTVRLYRNGTLVSTPLAATPVLSTYADGGQLFEVNWLGSTVASSSLIEVQVEGTASAFGTVEVNKVEWAVEVMGGLGYDYYDSGLINIALPSSYDPRDFPILTAAHRLPAPFLCDTIWIDLVDPFNFDGYLQVGRIIAGPCLDLDIKQNAWRMQWVDPSVMIPMRDGSERFRPARKLRLVEVTVPPRRFAKALAEQFGLLERKLGRTRAAFWKFGSEVPEETEMIGRLAQLPGLSAESRFFSQVVQVRELS